MINLYKRHFHKHYLCLIKQVIFRQPIKDVRKPTWPQTQERPKVSMKVILRHSSYHNKQQSSEKQNKSSQSTEADQKQCLISLPDASRGARLTEANWIDYEPRLSLLHVLPMTPFPETSHNFPSSSPAEHHVQIYMRLWRRWYLLQRENQTAYDLTLN